MTWLFLGIGAILVVGIALVAVGSAVNRLSGTLRPAVLEVDDAADRRGHALWRVIAAQPTMALALWGNDSDWKDVFDTAKDFVRARPQATRSIDDEAKQLFVDLAAAQREGDLGRAARLFGWGRHPRCRGGIGGDGGELCLVRAGAAERRSLHGGAAITTAIHEEWCPYCEH